MTILNEGFEGKTDENKMKGVCDTFSYEGKKSFRMDKDMSFSPGFNEEYAAINLKYYMWVRASAYVYPLTSPDTENFALVIDMNRKGFTYKYKAFEAKKMHLQAHKWNKISVDYLTPEIWHGSRSPRNLFLEHGKRNRIY